MENGDQERMQLLQLLFVAPIILIDTFPESPRAPFSLFTNQSAFLFLSFFLYLVFLQLFTHGTSHMTSPLGPVGLLPFLLAPF